MAKPLIKLLNLNGLPYNPNRDPQSYRRCVSEPFRIQALLDGAGEARCRLEDVQGRPLAEATVALPGAFDCQLTFDTPGSRIVSIRIEAGDRSATETLRLDVLERAWVG
jgi:hypothetical protein